MLGDRVALIAGKAPGRRPVRRYPPGSRVARQEGEDPLPVVEQVKALRTSVQPPSHWSRWTTSLIFGRAAAVLMSAVRARERER